mgnify:CR=1 FL=1
MSKEKQMSAEPVNENFSTRDLYLAATLITLKFPLLSTDFQVEGVRQKPVGYFQFENTVNLRDAKQKYISGLLMVEPKSFVNSMHSLKAEVVNFFQNPQRV